MTDFSSYNGPQKNPSRTRRIVLITIALLCLALIASQVFLHQTSVGSPKFVRGTFLLWAATVLVVLALLILATVLGRNLIKLYFERKSGQVGSRFKTKMVRTFTVLSLLPAVLLFFLAYGLVNFSIEQWFSAPAAQLLDNSRAIALQYYDETRERAQGFAESIAATLEKEGTLHPELRPELEEKLGELCRLYHVDGVRIYDGRGLLASESGQKVSLEAHGTQVKRLVAETLEGKSGFQVERVSPQDALREVVWATASIHRPDGRIVGAVLTEKLIPHSVHFKAYSVMEAYNVYEQLQKEKAALRFNFLLILALSTILIVFAFSWFAMYLAKRITVPIQALAEGAAAVAAGNLDYRVRCAAFAELENLVVSFNRMTGELQENKANIEAAQRSLQRTNVELDDRRRYIETILQAIGTGVLSIDSDFRVRTMNRAAIQMLQTSGASGDLKLEDIVPGSAYETLLLLLRKSSALGPVVRNIDLALEGKSLHLAATVSPLVDASGQCTGWVVVLDDLTELLRIEKMAAWQEVARRLAHEIKNPLTPIRLSAERMLHRFRQIWPLARAVAEKGRESSTAGFDSYDRLLEESVRTITEEADSLKSLVDEFSSFARLPDVKPEEADLHRVLENVLSLYNGRIQDVRIEKEFAPDIPPMRLDPEQMKRVFINLFDNALEAMSDSPHGKILQIRTSRSRNMSFVRIEVGDTGRGFPKEYQDSLFLPYFSTRKGGTGLGLAIVRQVISEHHGYVRAVPNEPLGTKIVIDLPLAPS